MKLLALSINGSYTVHGVGGMPEGGLDRIFLIVRNGIAIAIGVVIVLSLFSLIYSGIQWITSRGDEKALEAAKGRLTFSIIGLVLSLCAFFILITIARFFGLNPTSLFN